MNLSETKRRLHSGAFDGTLARLYHAEGEALAAQRKRLLRAVERFAEVFPGREDVRLFSAPGRTELGGNHTDHQNGCALGAAVNLDAVAVVAFHDEGVIRLLSEGFCLSEVSLSELSARSGERRRSISLIRGIASRFHQTGRVGGFDAYTVSDVLRGSGLSSSAAFETLVGTIIDKGCNGGRAGALEIARAGHYAENVYYGKGSGLLDQAVCSVGGCVFLDFQNAAEPAVRKLSFDFKKAGYSLCITDTLGSHANLADDYAAVPAEMKEVAACFGKSVLREVDERAFFDGLPSLRGSVSDRAILRAMHFFGENRRAEDEARALEVGDFGRFLALCRESGESSASLLQNLYSAKTPTVQGIPLAIAVSKALLGNEGAVRVHGGGFAGTVQAFVPLDMTEAYRRRMDAVFGAGACHVLNIRQDGGRELAV